MTTSSFRSALQAAVEERHQANHPLIDKWAAGEIKRETIAGAIREHWYWISNLLPTALFNICAKAPDDVVAMEMENYAEETDPANPHVELLLRFCEACGMSRAELAAGRGLPTTESWLDWELNLTAREPWIAGVAGVHIASEAQEPRLFSKVLPALRGYLRILRARSRILVAARRSRHRARRTRLRDPGQALRHAREAGHGAALRPRRRPDEIPVLGRHQSALRNRLQAAIAARRRNGQPARAVTRGGRSPCQR